uniref:CSON000722 protein n=1 Tax=Culicoides sonorensis TaxID=179676 RepID=A0A336MFA1_CULSO
MSLDTEIQPPPELDQFVITAASNAPKFVCGRCQGWYMDEETLLEHTNLYHEYWCKICNLQIRTEKELLNHMKGKHYIRNRCDTCRIFFRSPELAHNHMMSAHSEIKDKMASNGTESAAKPRNESTPQRSGDGNSIKVKTPNTINNQVGVTSKIRVAAPVIVPSTIANSSNHKNISQSTSLTMISNNQGEATPKNRISEPPILSTPVRSSSTINNNNKKSSTVVRQYLCSKCNLKFINVKDIARHMMSFHGVQVGLRSNNGKEELVIVGNKGKITEIHQKKSNFPQSKTKNNSITSTFGDTTVTLTKVTKPPATSTPIASQSSPIPSFTIYRNSSPIANGTNSDQVQIYPNKSNENNIHKEMPILRKIITSNENNHNRVEKSTTNFMRNEPPLLTHTNRITFRNNSPSTGIVQNGIESNSSKTLHTTLTPNGNVGMAPSVSQPKKRSRLSRECHICGRVLSSSYSLKRHLRDVHKIPQDSIGPRNNSIPLPRIDRVLSPSEIEAFNIQTSSLNESSPMSEDTLSNIENHNDDSNGSQMVEVEVEIDTKDDIELIYDDAHNPTVEIEEDVQQEEEEVPIEENVQVPEGTPVEESIGVQEESPVEESIGVQEEVAAEESIGIQEEVQVEEEVHSDEDVEIQEIPDTETANSSEVIEEIDSDSDMEIQVIEDPIIPKPRNIFRVQPSKKFLRHLAKNGKPQRPIVDRNEIARLKKLDKNVNLKSFFTKIKIKIKISSRTLKNPKTSKKIFRGNKNMSGRDRNLERNNDRGGGGGDRGKRFLRMDSKYPPLKISDPSLVVGKRKEIVNVMRKARDNPNDYWDKKLLEVEERDPDRWRHSGFKKLYVEGEGPSRSSSRSRSPRPRRISPSPRMRRVSPSPRPRSPPPHMRNRKPMPPPPKRRPSTSPPPKRPAYRPPSPPSVSSSSSSSEDSYRMRGRRSRSPVHRSPVHMKSSRFPEPGGSKNAPPPPMRYRSPSPPYRKAPIPEKRYAEKAPPEKPPRSHKILPMSRKHISPKPRVTSTSDEYTVKSKSRPQEPAPAPPKVKKTKRVKEKHVPIQRIKIEDEPKQRRARSVSSSSSSSSESGNETTPVFSALNASTRITLSERFGKIAQWSTDRTNMENMRITKNSAGGDLKVLIEEESSTNQTEGYLRNGNFPDALATQAPVLTSGSWDDINVRYRYYKGAGYLKGLTLDDYVRWEEWWYQYQEWLNRCQLWEASRMNPMNRRHRRKLPITARLN